MIKKFRLPLFLILSFFVFTSIGFSANKKIADNNASINKLSNRIKQLKEELDIRMKRLEQYQKTKEQISKEYNQMEERNPNTNTIEEKLKRLEEEYKNTNTINTIEEKLKHEEKIIESIQNEIAQLEKQLMLEHSKRRLQFRKKKQRK